MDIFKKNPNFPFLNYKYYALALSFIIILAGLLNMTLGKGLKLGVDFGEGTLIRVVFRDATSVGEVRKLLSDVGLGKSTPQETGRQGHEFQIRTIETRKAGKLDEEIETHQIMADQVIKALKSPEDEKLLAQGLLDLNNLEQKALVGLLSQAFPDQAEELAEKIIKYRTEHGIISDWNELKTAPTVLLSEEVLSFLKSKTFLGSLTVISRETVGPQVGKDLRKKATQAIIWSLIGMLVYIAIRFKGAEYGVAAIFTLFHDVLIVLGIYSFTPREINLPTIAALLTVVGYSINDTIIIFDRIRELRKTLRKESLENIMNMSININLNRTVLTTGTTFFAVLSLFLFGGKVINDFAFIMLIGVIIGTYSTVFLSCPVVLLWDRHFKKKRHK
jgi:preprotein translocase subunit SecF